ncbi:hypothetical protein Afil01_50000 [Actinorhabdospora filicis]|uniref:Serine protease n=1 Tax=Actinorhabdospora filicis TaxID=1785913 RepID=A0A9W6SPX1_9ACTN|nr:trypsin-like peptidase domain-containing protein [Actinorhabdospora filicis]GLZ80193.1 hypothetical protein Afil01_50000 [Actinorhabdospora filicis]
MGNGPERGVAFVHGSAADRAGLGFLAGGTRVVTCAHVVNRALGRDVREPADPGSAMVGVEFPFAPGRRRATVLTWIPGTAWSPADDLAVLLLDAPVDGPVPLRLRSRGADGLEVRMCGPDGDGLRHVGGVLMGEQAPGLRQIDQHRHGAYRVRPGFSGGPVWAADTGEVVGVMRAASPNAEATAAQCVDVARLGPVADGGEAGGEVSILQFGGLRFGSVDDAGSRRLAEDVAAEAGPVDVIVICGDLAARAAPSEYARAADFLAGVAAALGLGEDGVLTVPGVSDVNTALCRSHFDICAALEEEPRPPYWEKWRPYADFAAGAGHPLDPRRPWRLVSVPGRRLLLLALNSTMALTHRPEDDAARFGREQLAWFAERLADPGFGGWRRVAVSHHSPAEPPIARSSPNCSAGPWT